MLKFKKKSAVHSSFFSLGNRYIQLVLNIAALAVLGRLIEPKYFGIVAIVLAAQTLFAPLLDMGLSTAYVKLDKTGPVVQNPAECRERRLYNHRCILVLQAMGQRKV